MELASARTAEERSNQDKVDEEVITQSTNKLNAGWMEGGRGDLQIKRWVMHFLFLCLWQVFKKAYIPRTLNEVSHYERDVDAMMKEQENKQNDNVSACRTFNQEWLCLSSICACMREWVIRLWLWHSFHVVILDPVPDGDGAEKGSVRRADGKTLQVNIPHVVLTAGATLRISQTKAFSFVFWVGFFCFFFYFIFFF